MLSPVPGTATIDVRLPRSAEGAGILLPLAYARLFEFALTEEEVRRYASVPLAPPEIGSLIAGELSRLVTRADGYLTLPGEAPAAERRKGRLSMVTSAWATARKRAQLIGRTPFVRGLLVTGSLSHECFDHDADIDYLVLVAPRRLFTVFAVLGTVQRLTSVKVLCPNYYLAEDRLALPERDYFVAREVLAAAPVLGPEACAAFQAENAWAFAHFPNASPRPTAGIPAGGGALTRAVEWLLSGKAGDLVERLLERLLVSRIDAHYASCGVPVDPVVVEEARSGFRLRFHARLHRERVRARLAAELEKLGVPLPPELATPIPR